MLFGTARVKLLIFMNKVIATELESPEGEVVYRLLLVTLIFLFVLELDRLIARVLPPTLTTIIIKVLFNNKASSILVFFLTHLFTLFLDHFRALNSIIHCLIRYLVKQVHHIDALTEPYVIRTLKYFAVLVAILQVYVQRLYIQVVDPITLSYYSWLSQHRQIV